MYRTYTCTPRTPLEYQPATREPFKFRMSMCTPNVVLWCPIRNAHSTLQSRPACHHLLCPVFPQIEWSRHTPHPDHSLNRYERLAGCYSWSSPESWCKEWYAHAGRYDSYGLYSWLFLSHSLVLHTVHYAPLALCRLWTNLIIPQTNKP